MSKETEQKTIRIKKQDHAKLVKLQGKLQADSGLPVTLEDAFSFALDTPKIYFNGKVCSKLEVFTDEYVFMRATYPDGSHEDTPVLVQEKVE